MGSLAGKEWSMFEEGGFDTPSRGKEEFKSKLQFDLNESAKMVRILSFKSFLFLFANPPLHVDYD